METTHQKCADYANNSKHLPDWDEAALFLLYKILKFLTQMSKFLPGSGVFGIHLMCKMLAEYVWNCDVTMLMLFQNQSFLWPHVQGL